MANKNTDNIQQRVAKEILQTPETVSIGGVDYKVAPPSYGTLIAVSSMLRRLPEGGIEIKEGSEFETIISEAHRYSVVPRIVAMLILGAKEAKEPARAKRRGIFSELGFGRKKSDGTGLETKLDALAKTLENDASPEELKNAIAPLMERLELKDFFVLTTFLNRLNVTKPTKVETEATVHGRS